MSRRIQATLLRASACAPNERIVMVEASGARITLAIAVLPDGSLVVDPYHAQGRVIVRMGNERYHASTGLPVET